MPYRACLYHQHSFSRSNGISGKLDVSVDARLEETKMLLHNMGEHFQETDQQEIADLFYKKAKDAGIQAQVVHDSIFKHEILSGDIQYRKKKPR